VPSTSGRPFPDARGSASPLRMHVPDDAHPQGPFPMSAGGRQQGRIRAALACRPPPGGFGVHRTTTVSLRVAVCLWAALACIRTDRRPHGPATAVRLRAALGCVRTPGNRRPPPGGMGMGPDAARKLCLRAAWAFGRTPNLPGGGRRLPDAHRPFNLPYLEIFADMITINRKFELPTQK
jgi:hypothetical protein